MSKPRTPQDEEVWKARVRVPPRSVVIFTRQLAAMLISGVPIVQALETLSHQAEVPNFGQVVRILSEKISSGHPFSNALNQFPRIFPRIYVTMVQIGEQTGALDHSLEKLADWWERDHMIHQRIKSSLSYPIFVLCLAGTLTLGLFYWVLPGFIGIFRDMNVELPFVTRVVIAITNGVRNPGAWLVTIAVVGAGGTLLRDFSRTTVGAQKLFELAIRVPLLGGMLKNGSMARYCGAVAALLSSGMDMPRTFKLSAAASGNPLLHADSQALVEAIMEGGGASDHMLAHPKLYPASMVQMVIAGEQASRMPEMFSRVAAYYDLEMNYQVDALSAALEPLLLAGVASVVGTIVISIFLPMYGYLGKLGA